MRTFNFKREVWFWLIMLIPVAYLWISWNNLPEQVPVHFNLSGEADGWAARHHLIWLTLLVTFGLYLLMWVLPEIGPKRKLKQMGNKYDQLRLILVLFMSVLILFNIYYAQNQQISDNFNFLVLLLGGLIAALGNYFQTIRPNYFIGIRTPWTLESEVVWRKTHRLGGWLWLAGGILIMAIAFTPFPDVKEILLICILAVIVIIPVIYSFLESRNENSQPTV